jgi:hypothetical protein
MRLLALLLVLLAAPVLIADTRPPNFAPCEGRAKGADCVREGGGAGSCQPSICSRKVMFQGLERVEGYACLECQRPLTAEEKEAMKPPPPPEPVAPPKPTEAAPYAPEQAQRGCGCDGLGTAGVLPLAMLAVRRRRSFPL